MECKCKIIQTDEKGMKRMNRGKTNPWLIFGKDFVGIDQFASMELVSPSMPGPPVFINDQAT